MSEWVNWSGSFRGPVNEVRRPADLDELTEVVNAVAGQEGRVHAEGSRWGFSAPAYCDDVVVDTSALNGFPNMVQKAIRKPGRRPGRYLVAVEAGIKIHDLYRALAFDDPRGYEGDRPLIPRGEGRIWTLPVLGGAGGQSLAGAISTGTHGGDAARPPLSDAVRAILLVASGGRLLLIEPPGENVVSADGLSAALGFAVDVRHDGALFDAALVSVGRLGVVWAYVLEVHDESSVAIVEERQRSTWQALRGRLAGEAAGAAGRDEFLQVVVNPLRQDDGDHACFVTRHVVRPGHPTDVNAEPAHMHVHEARDLSGSALVFQLLASPRAHAVLATLPARLPALLFPGVMEAVGAQVALRLAEIGTTRPNGDRYLSGDALADILKDIRWVDPGWTVLRTLHAELLESEQRDYILVPGEPWKVKGTRFEIADFYEPDQGYRGDSIELFFGVDAGDPAALAMTIDMLLAVFDQLLEEKLQTAAYFSIRFMAATRATLGLARWPLTCSVEVAMLRGMLGNPRLLRLLRDVARERDGLVHWGQQNDLEAADVADAFGPALDDFRAQIPSVDGRLFRNRFTVGHGLEPVRHPPWTGWTDLGQHGSGAPSLPLGFEAEVLMDVFARNVNGVIESLPLDPTGLPADGWHQVRPEPVSARPVVFRGVTGRQELFAVDDAVLKHTYQEAVGGTSWSSWNVKGSPDPGRFDAERPAVGVAAHADGRLEVFGMAGWERNFALAHCWAHARDFAWGTVHYRGSRTLATAPSAANHRFPDGRDVLVVASTTADGQVVTMRQTDPADDAGWTDWRLATTQFRSPGPAGVTLAAPPGGPLHLFAVGPRDRLMMGTASDDELASWTFTDLRQEVDPTSPIATLVHGNRIWVATRDADFDVVVSDFAVGEAPRMSALDAFTFEAVALAGHPFSRAVQLVARTIDRRLMGIRLEPSG